MGEEGLLNVVGTPKNNYSWSWSWSLFQYARNVTSFKVLLVKNFELD